MSEIRVSVIDPDRAGEIANSSLGKAPSCTCPIDQPHPVTWGEFIIDDECPVHGLQKVFD